MLPRLALPVLPLLVLATALILAADARAGTYLVRQCHHSAPQNHAHEAIADVFPNPGPYAVAAGPGVCEGAGNDYAIQTRPTGGAGHGQYGLARFRAPAGISIIGVELDARLRAEAGHRARLSLTNAAGAEQIRFGAGDAGPAGFEHYAWASSTGNGYPQFTAGLICDNPGFNCPMTGDGDKSKADIRNVQLLVRDDVAPTVGLDGPLVSEGWKRGSADVSTSGVDRQSGLYVLAMAVNDTLVSAAAPLNCATLAGTSDVGSYSPCAPAQTLRIGLDTSQEPFSDGENTLIACAADYGQEPNGTCSEQKVLVDNTPPSLAFGGQRDQADPELIRASALDPTSGLAHETGRIEFRAVGANEWTPLATKLIDGELQARVDSLAVPPGNYEFRVEVSDVAGNTASATVREDGEPMVLEFPLKEQAAIEAELANGEDGQLVRFRKPGEVSGRLRDQSGEPIANATVTVVETFAEGSLIERRERQVTTGAKGRFESKLPGGPSRDVEVVYPGSPRFIGDAESGLDFDVRGKADLKTSKRRVRAGKAVLFKGRVRRYFAKIPPGGKLVEVQVRSGRSWTTLQEAKGTNRKGRIRVRHRFRGFYTQPVTFTFRLKALRESGWPYRGAAKSSRRRVTVIPKR